MSKPILCFDVTCHEAFLSVQQLRDHGFLKHPGARAYKCRLEGSHCVRSFEKWDSYMRHVNRKHDLRLNNNVPILKHFDQDNQASYLVDLPSATDMEMEESQAENFDDSSTFYSLLSQQAEILVAKIYNKPGLPRNLVDFIIEDVSSFMSSGLLSKLKSTVIEALQGSYVKDTTVDEINDMFDSLSSPFAHLSTEYLRQKHFHSSGTFIHPQRYTIETRAERNTLNRSVTINMKDVTGEFIPIRHVLKNFFELPDALPATLSYMKHLDSEKESISNMIQCSKWKDIKEKLYKSDDTVLPLTVYYDDWEPNNPLGPHSEQIGCVYVTVPCLPPECQSKLENMFVALLFNADDRKLYGNLKVFRPLIDELKFLESEGILIDTVNGKERVYFATVTLMGDNLGLHGTCGFVESFVARFPCRICKASKQVTESLCREDKSLLRNSVNYEEDVGINDVSLTGIKEELVFRDIKSLYCNGISSVFGGDAMHDGAEGIAHYTMIPVLRHFHERDPLFLESLNNGIYMFDYGKADGRNQPPSITPEMLRKNKLKMTASEMTSFVRFFGVFVGHLVSEDDQFWHLYLFLHDIMGILQAKILPHDIPAIFQNLVENHHRLYLQLTGEKLKPKHHFLLHYATSFLVFGPFANTSSMRGEGFHKVLKAYTSSCMSRRNLLYSLAKKRMFAMCLRTSVKESILPKVLVGPGAVQDLSSLKCFSSLKTSLPSSLLMDPEVFCAKWEEVKGTYYSPGMFSSLELTNPDAYA